MSNTLPDNRHLKLDELLDLDQLSPEKRAHFDGCPRCRFEARLLDYMEHSETVPPPGLDTARVSMSRQRETQSGHFRTHLQTIQQTLTGHVQRRRATDGPFELQQWMGVGQLGIVYRAIDNESGDPVAVKLLHTRDPKEIEAVSSRLSTLATIHHDNLCRPRRWGQGLPDSPDTPWFTMELIPGTDLLSWLRGDTGPASSLPREEHRTRQVAAFWQMACALSSLHDGGLVHGNLKPTNIQVDRRGRVVVLDAALLDNPISRLGEAQTSSEGITSAQQRSLPYQAPEVRQGHAASTATDWYAMGVIILEVLSGHSLPRRRHCSTDTSSTAAIQEQQQDWMERVAALEQEAGHDPTLLGLCRALLQAEPGSRPAGAAILRRLGTASRSSGHRHFPDLGRLGMGGMGEVRRVRDPALNRTMAMKVMREGLQKDPIMQARFEAEAELTAQLQHPGTVPVHELGTTPDGRRYFTMQEVRGRTMHGAIREVHQATREGRWQSGATGWTLHRLVGVLRRVCDAVAYAHARSVTHRDLKPDNVMLGDFGEVQVLDWGLAIVHGQDVEATLPVEPIQVSQPIATQIAGATRTGVVTGTPAYMAPEQARAEKKLFGPHSDVYALGTMLYEILLGRPAYVGPTPEAVLALLLDGPPTPLREAAPADHPEIPEDLVHICERAMAREPAVRFADAGELGEALQEWLEGARKRERALSITLRAQDLGPQEQQLRQEALGLRSQADAALRGIAPHAPISEKAPAWDLEDQANQLVEQAELRAVEREHLLNLALSVSEDLPEAHDLLADHHRVAHERAEAGGERVAAARHETLLRIHDRGQHTSYLRGDGSISLSTDPEATVVAHRYINQQRQLVTERFADLGSTPIDSKALPMGSYLLTVQAPGHRTLQLPVHIGREDHIGREQLQQGPLPLFPSGTLDPDDVVISAGSFLSGGDPDAAGGFPAGRTWVDGFIIRRFPVTNREYLDFLNDLVQQGREAEAMRVAPAERGSKPGEIGTLVYGRDDSGLFFLQPDADGDLWEPDWPVVLVGHDGAEAYARWLADHTGLPWRLPTDMEWEKAARGTDGRTFPWGNWVDPTWCHIRDSPQDRQSIVPVDSYPSDTSPYGVRGMAGNVRDWVGAIYRAPTTGDGTTTGGESSQTTETRRVLRGGSWWSVPRFARVCCRSGMDPHIRAGNVGFRVARNLPPRN